MGTNAEAESTQRLEVSRIDASCKTLWTPSTSSSWCPLCDARDTHTIDRDAWSGPRCSARGATRTL